MLVVHDRQGPFRVFSLRTERSFGLKRVEQELKRREQAELGAKLGATVV